MPKNITTGETITITTVKLISIAFALETDPITSLEVKRLVHTYELRDAAGTVWQRKTVGKALPAARQAAVDSWWPADEAEVTSQEGV